MSYQDACCRCITHLYRCSRPILQLLPPGLVSFSTPMLNTPLSTIFVYIWYDYFILFYTVFLVIKNCLIIFYNFQFCRNIFFWIIIRVLWWPRQYLWSSNHFCLLKKIPLWRLSTFSMRDLFFKKLESSSGSYKNLVTLQQKLWEIAAKNHLNVLFLKISVKKKS